MRHAAAPGRGAQGCGREAPPPRAAGVPRVKQRRSGPPQRAGFQAHRASSPRKFSIRPGWMERRGPRGPPCGEGAACPVPDTLITRIRFPGSEGMHYLPQRRLGLSGRPQRKLNAPANSSPIPRFIPTTPAHAGRLIAGPLSGLLSNQPPE